MIKFPPALVLIAGGFLLPFGASTAPRRAPPCASRSRPSPSCGASPTGAAAVWTVHGYALTPVKVDALGRLFATIFAIMAFAGGLFALNQGRTLELACASIYAGSAIGVALAGDLLTLFVFWELMALASTGVLIGAGGDQAFRAAGRYFIVHMLGGAFLMAGVLLHVSDTGSLAFDAMETGSLGTWLMLAGVLVNAAAPPLSAWLADAYPRVVVERAWCSSPHSPPRRRCTSSSGASPGDGGARLDRAIHDLLRDHLRPARERHAPDPRLQHREPGGVHGRRGRNRHRDGPERGGPPTPSPTSSTRRSSSCRRDRCCT